MKQSTHFAHVAKNLLTVLQGYTKGMRFTAVLTILFVMGVCNAWGAQYNMNWKGKVYFLVPEKWDISTYKYIQVDITRTQSNTDSKYQFYAGSMTRVGTSRLYYLNLSADHSSWGQNEFLAFTANSSNYGSAEFTLKTNNYRTKPIDYGCNNENNFYLFKPDSESNFQTTINDNTMSGDWNSIRDNLLKKTQSVDLYLDGTKSDAGGSVKMTGYYFTNNTTITSSEKKSSSSTVSYDAVIGTDMTLVATEKTGYSFKGWYNGSTLLSDEKTYTYCIYDTKTITAKFSAKTYTVTLDNQGATTAGQTSVTTTYNAAMPSIASNLPKKTGYTFNGYFDAVSGGTQYYNADGTSARTWNKTSNTTLYAQWKEQTFHLAGAMNGWSTTSNKMTISNGIATCTLSLAKGDYQFKIVESGETWRTASTTPRTITRTSNNLEFKTKGGSDNNTTITVDVEGTAEYVFNYDIANEKLTVLYPTAYTITYGVGNTKGTESVTTNPSVTSGNLVLAYTAITFSKGETKAGYTWKNWNSLADGSGTELGTDVTYVSANRAGDIAVYACYELVTYDIIYELDGGSGAENTTYNVETDVTLPTPTKTGHTFDGWYTTSDFSDDKVTEIKKGTTTGKKTFYAKWNAEIYDVKWYVNGVELTGDQLTGVSTKVEYGKSVKNIPSVDVSDYCGDKFVGWTTTSMDNASEEAPQIYTDEFPTAEGAQTFYAVFADYKD